MFDTVRHLHELSSYPWFNERLIEHSHGPGKEMLTAQGVLGWHTELQESAQYNAFDMNEFLGAVDGYVLMVDDVNASPLSPPQADAPAVQTSPEAPNVPAVNWLHRGDGSTPHAVRWLDAGGAAPKKTLAKQLPTLPSHFFGTSTSAT
jgi:hypothetical protein